MHTMWRKDWFECMGSCFPPLLGYIGCLNNLDCLNIMFGIEEEEYGSLLHPAEEEEDFRYDDEDQDWLEFRSPPGSSDSPPAKRPKLQSLQVNEWSSAPSPSKEYDSRLSSTHGHDRTIIHIDIDCFYAQVEMVRNPLLRNKPLGIKQKYLLVTCNYLARKMGVTKLMGIKEALKKCPDLVIVNGEDLTCYREFSRKVNDLARRYSPLVERLGLDENYIDVTVLVESRLSRLDSSERLEVSGYLYGKDQTELDGSQVEIKPCPCGCHTRLAMGSIIAAEIRDAIFREIGLTCCGGTGHSKLLAKLVGEVYKPNMQTTIFPEQAEEFLSSLRIRRIPGIGHATANSLRSLGIESVTGLKSCPLQVLQTQFGQVTASLLYRLCCGVDDSEVICSGNPKSISDEDSFSKCDTVADAKRRLASLIMNLLPRLSNDLGLPNTVRLSIRKWQGVHSYKRESRQSPVPGIFHSSAEESHKAKVMLDIVLELFHKLVDVKKPFHLTLFNVCLTNFHKTGKQNVNIITNFFTKENLNQDINQVRNKFEAAETESVLPIVPDSKTFVAQSCVSTTKSKQSGNFRSRSDLKSLVSTCTQCTPKEKLCQSKDINTSDMLQLKSPTTFRQNHIDSFAKATPTGQRLISEIDLPPGIDADVFRELPSEVQRELQSHWSHTKQASVSTDKRSADKDSVVKKKQGLLKYFSKV